jgi:hypothetical protein
MTFEEIEARIDEICDKGSDPQGLALSREFLRLGEAVLENWIVARGEIPAEETKEGFRLLALHRQGAKGDPSFNACRETCRELVYHYNLVLGATGSDPAGLTPDDGSRSRRSDGVRPCGSDPNQTLRMMALVAKHLCLFVSGKMQTTGLGEFCCAAKPVRAGDGKSPAPLADCLSS